MIDVKNISKIFNNLKAVNCVSFKAEAGEVFGLLGPNGAGKTTTLRMLSTVIKPTSGTAIINGHDIIAEPEQVRRNIGVLTSDIGLYGRLTARENVRYFGRLYGLNGQILEKRIDTLFKMLDMKAYADRRAENFSTGMKQKVAIARSIIHDPGVIVFDEPTSGLDVLASQTVIEFMRMAKDEGKCLILSTHLMVEAQKLCNRAAIIYEGRIVADDSIKSILTKTGKSLLEESFLELINASN